MCYERAESQRQYPDMPFSDADFQPAPIIAAHVPRASPWAVMTLAVGAHPKKCNPFFRWIFNALALQLGETALP
jgi:hypothetical protein